MDLMKYIGIIVACYEKPWVANKLKINKKQGHRSPFFIISNVLL